MYHDPYDCSCPICKDWMAKADDRERTGGANRALTEEEKDLKAIMLDVWSRQEKEVISNLNEKSFAAFAQKDAESTPLAVREWTEEIATLSIPVLEKPYVRGGNAALREISIELAEWIENPEAVEALKSETFKFAAKVNQTTVRNLQDTLIEAVKNGETIAQRKKRVEELFDGWVKSNRAEMIARTETARAEINGKLEAWRQSEVVTGKQWDASADACPFCTEMDGKEMDLQTAYWQEGESMSVEFGDRQISMPFGYGAVDGPPLHPSCRCSLIAIV